MKGLTHSLNDFVGLLKRDFEKLFIFSFVFIIVKSSAFGAALWMSNMVNIASFGLFEYALSGGLILAVIFNMGLQGAYPFFIIREKKKDYKAVFFFHGLFLSGLFFFVLLVNVVLGHWIPVKFSLMLLIAAVFGMQILYSTMLKSHEVLIKSILLDGGFFLSINLYNCLIYFNLCDFSIDTMEIGLMIYLACLWGLYAYAFKGVQNQFSFEKYKMVLNFGKHLVLSSFLIILLTGGARIFIEYFLAIEEVGYYGFYFRLAAITVMIHQIINIVFFKKMYQLDASGLDQYFSLFVSAILFLSVALYFVVPMVFSNSLTLLKSSFPEYRALYFILSFQVVFWIILALNENIIYRESLSSKMNRGFLLLLGAMTVAIMLFYQVQLLDVFYLTIINMIAIVLAIEWQYFILKKEKSIHFTQTQSINRLVLVLFFITYNIFL